MTQAQAAVEAEPATGSGSFVSKILLGGSLVIAVVGVASQAILAAGDGPAGAPLSPAAAFSVLAAPQQPSDIIASDQMRYLVRPETTRWLGESPVGTAYLAVSRTGDACLVTLRVDIAPEAGCSSWPTDRQKTVLLTDGPSGEGVALVPDGYEADRDWRKVGRNLLVRENN